MRIAIIADSHFSSNTAISCGKRQCGIADIIMRRAAFRIKRLIKADVVLLLGDLVNDGDDSSAGDELATLSKHLKVLDIPVIALPGNHDGSHDVFYEHFPKPAAISDVAGVRFITNVEHDEERPGYNAWRAPAGRDLLADARKNWSGPIVALQHVPLFPSGSCDSPYHYSNGDELCQSMAEQGVTLAISAHYHPGVPLFTHDGVNYLVAPALCEAPFPVTVVDIDGQQVRARQENLKMPQQLQLVDTHMHSSFAYCNENMDPERIAVFADAFGLAEFRITEHSGHLLYSSKNYYLAQDRDLPYSDDERRLDSFFAAMHQAQIPRHWIGLEIDARSDGQPLLSSADWHRAAFRIGAMHQLPSVYRRLQLSEEERRDEFLAIHANFLRHDFDSLAHPFRVFRRAKLPVPPGCFAPLVAMLKEHDCAAEINFHTNEPPLEFFRLCIANGVKITLGSDAHNLYEIGDFALHLDFLRQCGVDNNFHEVLAL
jgi:histidinol phosphatase-like PHP family hydrolase/predicted phosphodiesterase